MNIKVHSRPLSAEEAEQVITVDKGKLRVTIFINRTAAFFAVFGAEDIPILERALDLARGTDLRVMLAGSIPFHNGVTGFLKVSATAGIVYLASIGERCTRSIKVTELAALAEAVDVLRGQSS